METQETASTRPPPPAVGTTAATRSISLEDFVHVASSAALKAMQSNAGMPNPDGPSGAGHGIPGKPGTPGGPVMVWNPHIIVGLVVRNELGGAVNTVQQVGLNTQPGSPG